MLIDHFQIPVGTWARKLLLSIYLFVKMHAVQVVKWQGKNLRRGGQRAVMMILPYLKAIQRVVSKWLALTILPGCLFYMIIDSIFGETGTNAVCKILRGLLSMAWRITGFCLPYLWRIITYPITMRNGWVVCFWILIGVLAALSFLGLRRAGQDQEIVEEAPRQDELEELDVALADEAEGGRVMGQQQQQPPQGPQQQQEVESKEEEKEHEEELEVEEEEDEEEEELPRGRGRIRGGGRRRR
jgi:hypothetical protein